MFNYCQSIFKSFPVASLDLQNIFSAIIMLLTPLILYICFYLLPFYIEKEANTHQKRK